MYVGNCKAVSCEMCFVVGKSLMLFVLALLFLFLEKSDE
jgi:hypothetical protein